WVGRRGGRGGFAALTGGGAHPARWPGLDHWWAGGGEWGLTAKCKTGLKPPQDGGSAPPGRGERSCNPSRDRCPSARGCRAPDRRLERAPGTTRAHDLFAHDRCSDRGRLLVPVGEVPRLSNHQCNRLAHTRSSSRCGGVEPCLRAVMPIVPAKRAVRRARAAIANEHRRRNAGRTSSSRAGANDRLTKAAEKCRRDRDHVVLVTEFLRKPRR